MNAKTLEALRDAYRFITQPQVMSTPINGPRTVTYRLGDYNGLTAKLRAAIFDTEASLQQTAEALRARFSGE